MTIIQNSQQQSINNPVLLGASGIVVGAGTGAMVGKLKNPIPNEDVFIKKSKELMADAASFKVRKFAAYAKQGVDKLSAEQKADILKSAKKLKLADDATPVTKELLTKLIRKKGQEEQLLRHGLTKIDLAIEAAGKKDNAKMLAFLLEKKNKVAQQLDNMTSGLKEYYKNPNDDVAKNFVEILSKHLRKANMKKCAVIGSVLLGAGAIVCALITGKNSAVQK